ncbi:MAG: hypothetical protein FWG18_02490 [Alphaproteobacteria bacterium]|nr:hypothetical protein [Alphaproteobacteria bacterium]
MDKFRRAVFCYLILWAYAPSSARAMIPWILTLGKLRKRTPGWITIGSDGRPQLADWVLIELFDRPIDFDIVLSVLAGDDYAEMNKRDIAKLSRMGKNVIELWDTDPIFVQFPRLKTLARNREFEKMWAAKKQKVK